MTKETTEKNFQCEWEKAAYNYLSIPDHRAKIGPL